MDETDAARLGQIDIEIGKRERDYQARELYGDDASKLQALRRSIAALRLERDAIVARNSAEPEAGSA